MSAHTDFIRYIVERPFDDAPRLVYADWLEEQGHEWYGRFIRWQIAGMPQQPKPKPPLEEFGFSRLGIRERLGNKGAYFCRRYFWQRLKPYKSIWQNLCPLRSQLVSRGLIGALVLNYRDLQKYARKIFLAHPVVFLELYHPYHDVWDSERGCYGLRRDTGNDFGIADCWFEKLGHNGIPTCPKHSDQNFMAYESYQLASHDLSRLMVNHGRWLAGLPPIQVPEWPEISGEPSDE